MRGQTRPPEEIFIGPGGLGQAASSEASWVWVLAPGVRPRRDALEALLAAAQAAGAPAPVVLAGAVRNQAGDSIVRYLPAGDEHNPHVVDAVAVRALPIRNATFANCLVARACFDAHGLPNARRYGPFAPVQWSAGVLRVSPGYFVPTSVVMLEVGSGRREALRASLPLLRMMRTGAWTRGDTVANAKWWLHDAMGPSAGGAK